MKTARRQELKHNELAEGLEQLRHSFSAYGNYIVGGLVLIAVIVLGVVYVSRSAEQARATAAKKVRELPAATDEDVRKADVELRKIAADASGSSLAMIAIRRRAYTAMSRAHAAADGTPSAEFLDLAQDAYQEIIDQHPDKVLDVASALLGLATIEQDRFVLDQDSSHKGAVLKYLERILDDKALIGTPFQTAASDRKNTLDSVFVTVAMVDAPVQPLAPPPGLNIPAPQTGLPSADTTPVQPPTGLVPPAPGSSTQIGGEDADSAAPADDPADQSAAGDEAGDSETP